MVRQLNLSIVLERKPFEELCSCGLQGEHLAIYFKMGQYNKDDGHPELVGYDCPFEDSETYYACSSDHLETAIIKAEEETGVSFPDIIVNGRGEIQKELYISLARKQGMGSIDQKYFTDNHYSFGRESLEQFWEREKYRWIEE